MQQVQELLKSSLEEIERVVSSKTVVGDPIHVDGTTLIPLISIGFGFGAGGASGNGAKSSSEGTGAGTGAGVGIKPVAIIVIDKNGTRLECLRGGAASFLDHVGSAIGKAMEKKADAPKEG